MAVLVSACGLLDGGGRGGTSHSYQPGFDTDGLFEVEPNVAQCSMGALSADFQARILARLNEVRAWHGLPAVALAEEKLAATQAAALSIVANGRTNHRLTADDACFGLEAQSGAESSLLLMAAGNQVGDIQDPDRYLSDWMRDEGVETLGHRRWLLDPFVRNVAFGMVYGEPLVEFPYHPVIGAALHVATDDDGSLDEPIDLVAYPIGDYPTAYFAWDGYLSFSAVASSTSRSANGGQVDFRMAQIAVVDDAGTTLSATDVVRVSDVEGAAGVMGLPNVLYWRTAGLREGVRYTVRIVDVEVAGVMTDFTYDFSLR